MQRFRLAIAFVLALAFGLPVASAGTSITFNGATYTVPSVADANWGQNVSNYLTAIANGTLQKTGGSFTLTNDANFGSTYGLVAQYVKSQTAPVAGTGVLRLGNGDGVTWRNAGNSADLSLSVNGSNVLTFNGTPLVGAATGSAYQVLTVPSGGGAGAYGAVALGQSAAVTGTLGVANGGTGLSAGNSGGVLAYTASGTLTSSNTLTANGVLYGGGAGFTPGATAAGTTGQVLVGTTGSAPSWGTVNLASGAAVTGTLAVANGGTGVGSSTGSGSVVFSNSPTLTTQLWSTYGDLTEISTPAAPASGKLRLYSKSGDGLYYQGNATSETQLQAVTSKLTNFNSLADGSSGQVLTTLGSGTGYQWASGLTSTLTQYNAFVGNASNVATAVNTNLLGSIQASTSSATVTITIASPAVVTLTSHGFSTGQTVYLTTTGALPTGLSASTTYYVIKIDANTFKLATSLGNAFAGTAINTSGTQSGTHTLLAGGLVVGPNGIPGIANGAADVAGYVGESFEDVSGAFMATSAATLLSRTLQPGKWLITAMTSINSGAGPTGVVISISTTTNVVDSTYRGFGGVNTTVSLGGASVQRVVNITSPTTYYITGQTTGANATSVQQTIVEWVRIR